MPTVFSFTIALSILTTKIYASSNFSPARRQTTFTSFEDICLANADDCGNGFCCVEGSSCDNTSSDNPLCLNEANTAISVPAIDFSSYISEFSSLDALQSSVDSDVSSRVSEGFESFFSVLSNGELFSARSTATTTSVESSGTPLAGASASSTPMVTARPQTPVTPASVAPTSSSTAGAVARGVGMNMGGLVAAGLLFL